MKFATYSQKVALSVSLTAVLLVALAGFRLLRERLEIGNPGAQIVAGVRNSASAIDEDNSGRITPRRLPLKTQDIPVEDIGDHLRSLLRQPYSNERQSEIWNVCEKLSGDVGVEEAMRIISELAGPGQNRAWMLSAVVSGSRENFGMVMSMIRNLEYKDDNDACLNGLTSLVSKTNVSLERVTDSGPFSYRELSAIVVGLSHRPADSDDPIGDLKERTKNVISVINSADLNSDSNQMLGEYFRNLSLLAPQTTLALMVETMNRSKSFEPSDLDYNWVLNAAFKSDPRQAIEVVQSLLKGTASSDRLISSSIRQWMKYDLNSALQWYSTSDQFGSEIKSYAAFPFFEQAVAGGDLSASKQWYERIDDPVLKRKAEGQVWSMERDIVRREVSKDPELAIQSMIAGDSSHQDYWLEEAIATWAVKEPTKAQAWYQQNWNSLSANKAQYVAAAFATQATKQGDTATARQWAAYIQDAKTKQRIETGIAKAESAKQN